MTRFCGGCGTDTLGNEPHRGDCPFDYLDATPNTEALKRLSEAYMALQRDPYANPEACTARWQAFVVAARPEAIIGLCDALESAQARAERAEAALERVRAATEWPHVALASEAVLAETGEGYAERRYADEVGEHYAPGFKEAIGTCGKPDCTDMRPDEWSVAADGFSVGAQWALHRVRAALADPQGSGNTQPRCHWRDTETGWYCTDHGKHVDGATWEAPATCGNTGGAER